MYVLTCKCVCICIQYTCKNGIKFWWAFTVCHQVSPINCYRFNTDIARIQLHCNVDMRTNFFFFKALLDATWKGSLKLQLMPIWLETLHSGQAVNNFGLTGVREDHNLVLEMMWISATRKRIQLGILFFSPSIPIAKHNVNEADMRIILGFISWLWQHRISTRPPKQDILHLQHHFLPQRSSRHHLQARKSKSRISKDITICFFLQR